jgi:acyl-CoA thioester hydrolase
MFIWPIRVYYEDTDAGGVVYHSQYLNFLERARTEWLRALGIEQAWLKSDLDTLFVVHSLQAVFKKPALFDDAIEVRSRIAKTTLASITFEQFIYRQDALLFSATVKIACVSASQFSPAAIPQQIKEKMLSVVGNE